MAIISKASAHWEGGLKDGRGSMKPANAAEAPFGLGSRFEGQKGSNPEELIGAALSGCFSMALSASLGKAGLTPKQIDTQAAVHLEREGEGFKIAKIELSTYDSAVVPATALREEGSTKHIFVVSQKKLEERVVETGEQVGDIVAIAKGVAPGDVIVARNGSELKDGTSVE